MSLTFETGSPLLHLAFVLVAGIIGGELVGRIGLPKVTGWICTGIVLRSLETFHSPLTGLTTQAISGFDNLMSFVLGYISFTVGAALHFASLRNSRKRLSMLLIGEAIVTPSLVGLALYFIGRMISPDEMTVRASCVLAAIAIAGAPGTTVLVVQEARSRGILTRTLISAVALIDMVAVGFFTFVIAYFVGISEGGPGWVMGIRSVAYQFGMAFVAGSVSAGVALALTRTIVGPAFLGPAMVAVILGSWGGAVGFKASGILACTFAGIVVSNVRHDTVRSAEAYLQSIGGVLFAAFYTIAGMKLNFAQVLQAAGLVALFFFARLIGKYTGAFIAMSIAEVPVRVRNYFGLTLVPHGGVAVGLILLTETIEALNDISEIVTTVGLAALAINQLVGPSAARFALTKAGEAGMDHPRLLDFLDEHHITVNVAGSTKEEIIRSLASQLYTTQDRPMLDQEAFVQEVLKREELESTCLSEGLMVPHAELPEGHRVTGMLGISSKGVNLGAPDGQPIHAILLLATPKADRKKHLEILAAFATAISSDVNLREQLYHARSAAHAYDVLHADAGTDINYFIEDAMTRAGVAEDSDA